LRLFGYIYLPLTCSYGCELWLLLATYDCEFRFLFVLSVGPSKEKFKVMIMQHPKVWPRSPALIWPLICTEKYNELMIKLKLNSEMRSFGKSITLENSGEFKSIS
jgi:hypothetical protein